MNTSHLLKDTRIYFWIKGLWFNQFLISEIEKVGESYRFVLETEIIDGHHDPSFLHGKNLIITTGDCGRVDCFENNIKLFSTGTCCQIEKRMTNCFGYMTKINHPEVKIRCVFITDKFIMHDGDIEIEM